MDKFEWENKTQFRGGFAPESSIEEKTGIINLAINNRLFIIAKRILIELNE
jgi:hypothetical protein